MPKAHPHVFSSFCHSSTHKRDIAENTTQVIHTEYIQYHCITLAIPWPLSQPEKWETRLYRPFFNIYHSSKLIWWDALRKLSFMIFISTSTPSGIMWKNMQDCLPSMSQVLLSHSLYPVHMPLYNKGKHENRVRSHWTYILSQSQTLVGLVGLYG